MSNPTELPNLDRLEALQRFGWCDIADRDFIERPDGEYVKLADVLTLARRAQPEGEALAGRLVSVDVSTSEEDGCNRIFAELTGETGSDGTTLLAFEKSRNFDQPEGEAPQAVGFHIVYDQGRSVDYKATEREAHVHARELVENGWLDVNVRTLTYAAPAAQHAESGKERGSIEDYNEFNRLLDELEGAKLDAHACGNDFGTGNKHQVAYENLVVYIDKWAARCAPGTPEAPAGLDLSKITSVVLQDRGSKSVIVRFGQSLAAATKFLDQFGTLVLSQRAAQLDGGQEGSESNG